MGYVHEDEDVRNAARVAEARIQQWAVDLIFRDDLYEAVSGFAATEEAAGLTGERGRLLEFTLRDLRRAGHELDPDIRAEVRELTSRLVELVPTEDHDLRVDLLVTDEGVIPENQSGETSPR